MDGCVDAWMYGCMDLWMYGCMAVWLYGCMDGWMGACMHACIIHQKNTSLYFLSRFISPAITTRMARSLCLIVGAEVTIQEPFCFLLDGCPYHQLGKLTSLGWLLTGKSEGCTDQL